MNAFLDHVKPLYNSDDPLRTKAWARFQESGIPEYNYLPLTQLRNFKIAAAKKEIFLEKNADSPYSLVFVNGIYRPDLSSPIPDNVVLMPLSRALVEFSAFLPGHLEAAQKEETDGFALMTEALAEGANFLYIPPHTKFHTEIINIHTAKSAFTRLNVFMGKRSDAEISLKNYTQTPDSSFASENLYLHIEEEATCRLEKIDQYQSKQWAFSFVRAFQKARSSLHITAATCGALSARHDYKMTLAGQDAKAFLAEAARLKGFNQAHAKVLIKHLAPHTESHQLFKTILEDVSRSSFQGEIYVAPEALKTNAFQLSKSLLLSDKAISYNRPELQILADDVKASHGCTVGQMDEEMLFYLQSRGISHAEAAMLLINSFSQDVLNHFSTPLSLAEAQKLLA